MKNFSLILLGSLSLMSSCKYLIQPKDNWGLRPRMSEVEAKSFEVFYEGNPNPPKVEEKDYIAYKNLIDDPKYADLKKKLTSYFGNNYSLWAYYFLDMDNDGQRDWDWEEKEQKFVALDQDLDEDGVPNIEDEDPYNYLKGNFDLDNDGIADHLDWDQDNDGESDRPEISSEMSSQQLKLFQKYKVIAVNQDAKHNTRTLKTFDEVLSLAFQKIFDENQGAFPGLRYVAAQHGEKRKNVLAWYSRLSQQITILNLGREEAVNQVFPGITPMPFYATVIHELSHTLEKYLQNKLGTEYIATHGLVDLWTSENGENLFKGKNKEAWKDLIIKEKDKTIEEYKESRNPEKISEIYNFELKQLNLAQTFIAKKNAIVSLYSLTSPAEYFAESVPAYIFKVVSQKRFAHKPKDQQERLQKKFERIVTFESGLGIKNVPKGLEKIIETELEVSSKLKFDINHRNQNGTKGKWIRLR